MSQWYAKMACVKLFICNIFVHLYTFIWYLQQEKGLFKREWGRVSAKKLNVSNVPVWVLH